MTDLNEISRSLQAGKSGETVNLIHKAIKEKYSPDCIIKQGLMAGMQTVEQRFRRSEIFAPELLLAERAMNRGIETIRACAFFPRRESGGTVVIGTVKGELQDIKKNLTKVLMDAMGLRVIDLGVSVGHDRFIAAAESARLIIAYAELTTTMPQIKILVQALIHSELKNRVKIMICGSPVTEQYRYSVGADLYGGDPAEAAEKALKVLNTNIP
jgi:methanogenic corrinoid protein MtbC1